MKAQDYILLGVIALLAILAIIYLWIHRHEHCGKNTGCSACPFHEQCQKKKKENG